MPFAKFIAQQLAHPSNLVGRFFLGPVWNKRNSALNDAAFERLALRPDDLVLEVGFGGGYLLGRMAAVVTAGFLAGVDASPAMVEFCEKRFHALAQSNRLELGCAQAEALPYPSGHFTRACTVNSIFYWQNAPQAIAELARVLQANGRLVMVQTCKESLGKREFARHGVTLYEAGEVEQMMLACEFHDIRASHSQDQHRQFFCLTGIK